MQIIGSSHQRTPEISARFIQSRVIPPRFPSYLPDTVHFRGRPFFQEPEFELLDHFQKLTLHHNSAMANGGQQLRQALHKWLSTPEMLDIRQTLPILYAEHLKKMAELSTVLATGIRLYPHVMEAILEDADGFEEFTWDFIDTSTQVALVLQDNQEIRNFREADVSVFNRFLQEAFIIALGQTEESVALHCVGQLQTAAEDRADEFQ